MKRHCTNRKYAKLRYRFAKYLKADYWNSPLRHEKDDFNLPPAGCITNELRDNQTPRFGSRKL